MNGEQPRASLRRQIVLWYSLVLLVALGGFTVVTHLLLRQALDRTGTASLRDAAEYTERLNIPPEIPRAVLSEQQGRERLGNPGVAAIGGRCGVGCDVADAARAVVDQFDAGRAAAA